MPNTTFKLLAFHVAEKSFFLGRFTEQAELMDKLVMKYS